ncbi:IS5 family transposase [Streptomyces sp. NBC_00572]|uniref:IS5 family transposase n=1 Tax=Streptomyces sp. NBC_00572 TaxID=2903664 RepID=UPI002255EA86|nr:IS5 family transposase [Streptomyces sp. NBC_00572]MCX4984743.1 IS5 family transposase [Streptomyces sp. NBC_00572]
MSDAEWAAVRPLLPVPAWLEGRGGQPEGYCHRQILDAVRYLLDNGIKWRAIPADFPAWDRVYAFFRRWRRQGLINEFHDRLRSRVRELEGRQAEPTAAIIDSQSLRAADTVGAGSRGWDAGKKVGGRKRHIAVDCGGLLLAVRVTAASVQDRDAATPVLERLRELHRKIAVVWADSGYVGRLVGWAKDALHLALTIVRRSDDQKGFVILPRRWVVERTLAWLMHRRRLVRDYERLPATHETMVMWSMTMIMGRRLARGRPALTRQPKVPSTRRPG